MLHERKLGNKEEQKEKKKKSNLSIVLPTAETISIKHFDSVPSSFFLIHGTFIFIREIQKNLVLILYLKF